MSPKNRNKKSKKDLLQQKQPPTKARKNNSIIWVWVAMAVVLVSTFAIYYKAISYDLLFSWDDNIYVRNNSDILSLHWENIKLFFTRFYVANYQPVTMLFYAVDHQIGAGNASVYHFNSILLHIFNSFLVYVLIRKISPRNAVVALITAAFFAVHPMHVESVAWVAERKDVLYSFFFLLSLIMYCRYLKDQKIRQLIFSGIFFLLSCLSKSAAVVLPLVMLLLDYYSERKYNWKLILEKIPFFVISLIIGLVATQSQKNSIQELAPNMSAIEHIAVVSYSFMSYLFKTIIPVNLSAIYTYPVELGSILPVKYYISILLVALLSFFVWYSRKWGREIVFGFLFFLVTIILVLQLVPVGIASMADRYTYIPYIGLLFMIGKLFEHLSMKENVSENYKRNSIILLIAGYIIFLNITNDRVKIWENDEILFSDVINKYPNCAPPYNGRGSYYMNYYANRIYADDKTKREAYLKMALNDFETSLKYESKPNVRVEIYYNRGITKGTLGDYEAAIKDFDNAIKIDTNYVSAYMNRGGAKFMLKDYEGALKDCKKAIRINPQDPQVIKNMDIVKIIEDIMKK